jgi:hypothetical protein
MQFFQYVGKGFSALKYNKEAIATILADSESKRNSYILTAVVSAVGALLIGLFASLFLFMSDARATNPVLSQYAGVIVAGVVVGGFLLIFLSVLLSVGITHALAKLFGGVASISQYFTVWLPVYFALIIVSIPVQVLSLIPILGFLITLALMVYSVSVQVFAIRETYKISTGRAVWVVLIPILLVIAFIIAVAVVLYASIMNPVRMAG